MGGDLQRHETIVLLNDASTCEMLRRKGWLDYFLSLKGFNEEVSLQFMTTLKDGVVEVKGLKVEFIEDAVA